MQPSNEEKYALQQNKFLFGVLANIPAGFYELNYGWLSVEVKDGGKCRELMWTSHKEHHEILLSGWPKKAFCIKVSQSGELIYYMSSALGMWLVWGLGRTGFNKLEEAIKLCEWTKKQLELYEENKMRSKQRGHISSDGPGDEYPATLKDNIVFFGTILLCIGGLGFLGFWMFG